MNALNGKLPTDQELNAALEQPLLDDVPVATDAERREMRLAEYHDRILDHDDPLVALIGSLNTYLLALAGQIGGGITQALRGGASIEAVQEISPVLTMYQQLTRQIGRFAQFELQAGRAEQEGAARKHVLMAMDVDAPPRAVPHSLAATRRAPRRLH